MSSGNKKEEKPKKEREIVKAAKGSCMGWPSLHGMVTYALRVRMHIENLFMLITMSDMLGSPSLPPYYSLRLLPYAVPYLKTWKRMQLRDRNTTDSLY